jgi:enoyl-CoA hydratase/carnithine racemase
MSVLLEKRTDGVAIVTLNRPQVLNALDVPAKERLGDIWQEISDDPQVRVAVLMGAGGKAFCAGSDIKEINRTGRMVTTETLKRAIPGVGIPLDKPVIAALNGYCIGMGMSLAMHCDLRLAAKDAVLGYPEVKHGMISAVSALRLPQLIPSVQAMEMLLLARNRSARLGREDRQLLARRRAGDQAIGDILAPPQRGRERRSRSRAGIRRNQGRLQRRRRRLHGPRMTAPRRHSKAKKLISWP